MAGNQSKQLLRKFGHLDVFSRCELRKFPVNKYKALPVFLKIMIKIISYGTKRLPHIMISCR